LFGDILFGGIDIGGTKIGGTKIGGIVIEGVFVEGIVNFSTSSSIGAKGAPFIIKLGSKVNGLLF